MNLKKERKKVEINGKRTKRNEGKEELTKTINKKKGEQDIKCVEIY